MNIIGDIGALKKRKWEQVARELCFKDCSKGVHLDFESGCCSVCESVEQCQGWRAYSTEAMKEKMMDKAALEELLAAAEKLAEALRSIRTEQSLAKCQLVASLALTEWEALE